jgi:hypothetical protein
VLLLLDAADPGIDADATPLVADVPAELPIKLAEFVVVDVKEVNEDDAIDGEDGILVDEGAEAESDAEEEVSALADEEGATEEEFEAVLLLAISVVAPADASDDTTSVVVDVDGEDSRMDASTVTAAAVERAVLPARSTEATTETTTSALADNASVAAAVPCLA